jgi:hypothetical protein
VRACRGGTKHVAKIKHCICRVPSNLRCIQFLNEGYREKDGALSHVDLPIGQFLGMFPARLIGRGGRIAWPTGLPCLTPMEFFPSEYMKDQLNHT